MVKSVGADIPSDALRFLHLSDIHFHVSKMGDVYELDGDLRNELERDAVYVREMAGSPHAIVITGDIAFSGAAAEYDRAREWLVENLCARIGTQSENVYCIPGNHDVDFNRIKTSRSIRDCHSALRRCAVGDIDQEIAEYSGSDSVLYQAIETYNTAFAQKFACDISVEDPYWTKNFTLNDTSILKVRGLNSTLISDNLDNDKENKLVLGEFQSRLKSEDGVCYMSLCHHPPQWLRDADAVQKDLGHRARIQLFGHKHDQTLNQIDNSLRLTAGAVHPERGKSWLPRYNWLAVWVTGTRDQRLLNVSVFPRVWSRTKPEFSPDYDACSGKESRLYQLSLDSWTAPISIVGEGDLSEHRTSKSVVVEATSLVARSSAVDPARTLAHRFLTLSYLQRLDVARKLDLIAETDELLTERERSRQFFIRAKERRILSALWDEVEHRHGDRKHDENPFKTQETKEL